MKKLYQHILIDRVIPVSESQVSKGDKSDERKIKHTEIDNIMIAARRI